MTQDSQYTVLQAMDVLRLQISLLQNECIKARELEAAETRLSMSKCNDDTIRFDAARIVASVKLHAARNETDKAKALK